MLSALTAFELRYQVRRASFSAAVLGFVGVGVALVATRFGPPRVEPHSPWWVANVLAVASLLSVFALAAFSAHALVRDTEFRMADVLLATPMARWRLYGGRFLGSLAAGLLAFLGVAVGALVTAYPAPVDVAAWAWGLGVMALPTLVFVAATLFFVAARTRSTLACHAAAVTLYGLYFAAAALTDSSLMASSSREGSAMGWWAVLDPFGLTAFYEQTRHWTTEEQNTRFVALTGVFGVNRLLTLLAAGVLLALAPRGASPERSRRVPTPEPTVVASPLRAVRPSPRWWATWAYAFRLDARAVVLGKPVLGLLAVWGVVAFVEVFSDLRGGEYGVGSYATTSLVLPSLEQPLQLFGLLAVLAIGAELAWRDRRTPWADTVLSTPAAASALVAARWSVLASLSALLALVGVVAGVAAQLVLDGAAPAPVLYATFVTLTVWPLLAWAALVLLVHALSPGKYVGLLLSVALVVVARRLEHPLLRFGFPEVPAHSELAGFGGAGPGFVVPMLHWSVVAVVLLALAAACWRAGAGGLRTVPRGPALAGLVAVVVSGAVWRGLDEPFESRAALNTWKADYERAWSPRARLPQPVTEHLDFTFAFDPQRLHVSGLATLVNRTDEPVREVDVTLQREARDVRLSLDGAGPGALDARFAVHTFVLATPLEPGGRTTLRFDYRFEPGWLAPDQALVASGAMLRGYQLLPGLGYRRTRELSEPREREKHGLPPRDADPEPAHDVEPTSEWITFSATITTPPGLEVAGSGERESTRRAGDRRVTRFHADAPVLNNLCFAVGDYAVTERRHGEVTLQVFHHRAHTANLERIFEGAGAAVDLLGPQLGRYPFRTLQIAELPSTWRFGGYAFPGGFFLSEQRGFLVDARDPQRVDLVLRRVAHETAHQWFGYLLTPPTAPGAPVLVESLAKDADHRVLRRLRGDAQAQRMLEFELDRYLRGRASEQVAEVPLTQVRDEAYLYYGKGTLALHALRRTMGDAAVDAAIRALVLRAGGPGGQPHATDLVAQLDAQADDATRPLVHEWFETTAVSDFTLHGVRATPRADGGFEVVLDVESAQPDAVEIALSTADGRELLRERRPLPAGRASQTFVTAERPTEAVLDPRLLRLERGRQDNARAVDAQ